MGLAAKGRRGKPREGVVPLVVRLLAQAEEYQRMIDAGEVRFRAELAQRSSVSPIRISQIMALLRLAPEIQKFVAALPAGTPARRVTEAGLRRYTRMPVRAQLRAAARHVPGFRVFLDRSGPAGT